MNRIAAKFDEVRSRSRPGFIPFITAGDPDIETCAEIVLKLAELGADVIELGVPFSDPIADGPTIQLSSQRALEKGVNLPAILEMTARLRSQIEIPIVLFSYLNPLISYGIKSLADDASAAGIDGVLVTDAVDEEAAAIARIMRERDIDLISLIAPTTADHRLRSIANSASGFLYAVSRAGVTGARADVSSQAENLVSRARHVTDLPVAVGFGISTRQQIESVWRYADAAVVGSAIVNEISKNGTRTAVERVADFVTALVPQTFAND